MKEREDSAPQIKSTWAWSHLTCSLGTCSFKAVRRDSLQGLFPLVRALDEATHPDNLPFY